MSFKKEIENKKKFNEVKNRFKDMVNTATKTIQNTVDSISSNMDTIVSKQFKKDVYSKSISYVEGLVIESNLETATEIKVSIDEAEGFTSIADVIRAVAIDEASKELAEKESYLKTVFDVLVNHFSNEDELELEVTDSTMTIKIKDEPAETETEKEAEKEEKEPTEE